MGDPPFLPTNTLETALMRAAVDPTDRPEFSRLLLESPLYVLTPIPNEVGARTTGPNEEVKILQWLKGDRSIIPIFTSIDWLRQALPPDSPRYGFLGMKGKALFETLATGDLPAVLNPRCPYGKEFPVHEIRQIASGEPPGRLRREVVQEGRQVLLGQPAVYPQSLVDAVRKRLPRHAAVRKAYLAWMHDPASNVPPHAIIGLDLEPGADQDQIIPPIGEVANAALGQGEFVDFTVLRKDGLSDHLRSTAPFYEREAAPEKKGFFGRIFGK
jgi:hypothetical protein